MLASAAALAEGLQQPLPPDERAQRVDALFSPWDTDDAPGAVVAVYEDEKLAYAKGYGIANLDLGVPLTPQSALRVGSISKQFIGMCIALLAEEGKLDFDESVRLYLPELPKYAAPITVRHLLHHTSGLREYLSLVELIGKPEGGGYPYTNDEVIELLARQEALLFPPGTAESYSNSNYFLLAEIVKRVSGVTTSAFAKAHIFEPLGMVNTRFADNPNAIIPNRAWGYSPIGDDQFRMDILLSEVIGDLGVVTTAEDFLLWDRNLRNNRLGRGDKQLLDILYTRGELNDGTRLNYSLGIEHGVYRGLRTLGHSGSAVGYVAQYLQFPDQKLSVVVFSNDSSFRPGGFARRVADIYLEAQLGATQTEETMYVGVGMDDEAERETARSTAPAANGFERFAGKYYSRELHYIYLIELQNDALTLEVRRKVSTLVPVGGARFLWGRRHLNFAIGREGAVVGFNLLDEDLGDLFFERVLNTLPVN